MLLDVMFQLLCDMLCSGPFTGFLTPAQSHQLNIPCVICCDIGWFDGVGSCTHTHRLHDFEWTHARPWLLCRGHLPHDHPKCIHVHTRGVHAIIIVHHL